MSAEARDRKSRERLRKEMHFSESRSIDGRDSFTAGEAASTVVGERRSSSFSSHEAAKARALSQGFSKSFASELGKSSDWRAYFADVGMLRRFACECPELLLLPWERMRAMGVLAWKNPVETDYTFLTHQWEHPTHPFPDLLQITEHIDLICTPYLCTHRIEARNQAGDIETSLITRLWFRARRWLDWYSVPQWSRACEPPDPLAIQIFGSTMKSFHKLCFCSDSAFIIFKRGGGLTTHIADPGSRIPGGSVSLRPHDPEKGQDFVAELRLLLDEAAEIVDEASVATLSASITALQEVGIDLEYAIRAWCVLERCYLPPTRHNDVRILRLRPALSKLRDDCMDIMAALSRRKIEVQPVALMVSLVEQIESILEISQPDAGTQKLYRNAWSYHCAPGPPSHTRPVPNERSHSPRRPRRSADMKRQVLTIGDPDDFKYIDKLLVSDAVVGDYGGLYLQSIAGGKRANCLDGGLDPKMHLPRGKDSSKLKKKGVSLYDLLGSSKEAADRGEEIWALGAPVEKLDGALLLVVKKLDMKKKKIQLELSDAGFCGGHIA